MIFYLNIKFWQYYINPNHYQSFLSSHLDVRNHFYSFAPLIWSTSVLDLRIVANTFYICFQAARITYPSWQFDWATLAFPIWNALPKCSYLICTSVLRGSYLKVFLWVHWFSYGIYRLAWLLDYSVISFWQHCEPNCLPVFRAFAFVITAALILEESSAAAIIADSLILLWVNELIGWHHLTDAVTSRPPSNSDASQYLPDLFQL
jgi:hypothetical protein